MDTKAVWSAPMRWLARAYLAATGWHFEGARPALAKCVMIAAPHTSNWDFPYMLAFAIVNDVNLSWMGKHTLFKIPGLGRMFRWLGGIPIVRHEKRNVVEQMADRFQSATHLILAVQPEGTRRWMPHWRSGFYRIAQAAGVPIMLGYLDYARRRGGFGPALTPSGDIRKDMDVIRAFYSDKRGKYPENFGPVKLPEEESAASTASASTGA